MRYFIVRYLRKPSGQMDELVAISKKIKMSDAASAAVILDFRDRRVEKAHLDGVTLPREFSRIRDFYNQHYPASIKDLETLWPPPTNPNPDTDPVSS